MTKKITILFLLLATAYGYSQKADCTVFKNGTFKVTDPATKKVCIITRDGDIQTEKMEDAAEIYDFEIKWLDDCTYTVNPTPATAARNKDVLKAGTMTVKITKVKDSSYVQRITVANNPKFRRIDEVFLVKEKKKG
jgi:hypothetical protein